MNHVKMTSPCLQGLSPFLLSNSSTTVFYSQTYRGITRRNYHIDTNAQEEEIRYQQTEVFFMVVKDVDSVMTCGAALAQTPKGEKHFANTVPCNTGFYSQSYCSHFQTKKGHFLYCLSQTDCHELDVTTCMGHSRCL